VHHIGRGRIAWLRLAKNEWSEGAIQEPFRILGCGALERFITAYRNGTYREWREAMHLLAADTSPGQWEEVIQRFRRREQWTVANGPVVRECILARDQQTV
jgi:hypothetical protein